MGLREPFSAISTSSLVAVSAKLGSFQGSSGAPLKTFAVEEARFRVHMMIL